MKNWRYLIFGVALIFALSACENEKNLFNDTPSIYLKGDATQNAVMDSVFFSFKEYEETMETYDLNLLVYVVGNVADRARTFELEVVDSSTNVAASDYAFGTMEIPAGAFYATVPVTVKRNIAGLDLTSQNAVLTVKVKANSNFEEGPMDYSTYKLVWCDYLVKPKWWQDYYLGTFSQARYKFMLDYYEGNLEEIDWSDYNQVYGTVSKLIMLLDNYNANHEKPYLDDNGSPLRFG